MNLSHFTTYKFLIASNAIMVIAMAIFLIDYALPLRKMETEIVENEFARKHRRGSTTVYTGNVTLVTKHGTIFVKNSQLRNYTTNHRFHSSPLSASLFKTRLFGQGRRIIIHDLGDLSLKRTAPEHNEFLFFPFLFMILGGIVLYFKSDSLVTNLGSFNLVLLLFYLILMSSDIGWDEY